MVRSFWNALTHLPVGRKLLCGFGLISVLSMVPVGIALEVADELLAGNCQGQGLADLNLLLLEARRMEKVDIQPCAR